MTRGTQRLLTIALAIGAGIGCLLVSEKMSLTKLDSLVATAEARIGRPLTPISFAGAARRSTRRAVAAGAAGGPSCFQRVTVFGGVVSRC